MFSDERKVKIIESISTNTSVSVSDLALAFGVSESTIRRDLQELEDQGRLKRTHGGAVSLEVASFEPTFADKAVRHSNEKKAIAKAAVSLIQPGDTILLDAGTTTFEIAQLLPDMDITVVTNSLAIASVLASHKEMHLVVLGGEHRLTTGALVGPMTEAMLSFLNVDRLFLGANGVDLLRGITTPNVFEAATKKAMIRSAKEICLVVDMSKFGQINLAKICDIDEIDVIITDCLPDEKYGQIFAEKQIHLQVFEGR